MTDVMATDISASLFQASRAGIAGAAENVREAQKSRNVEKATETARDFEAVFIAEMMKPMFEGLSTEAPFGGGKGEEVFRGMLLQEYGKIVAETGRIGLADHVRDEMVRMQESIDDEKRTKNP